MISCVQYHHLYLILPTLEHNTLTQAEISSSKRTLVSVAVFCLNELDLQDNLIKLVLVEVAALC